jgi:UDP-2,3-diacylglucosamine pyrophosphatase LpxH
VIVIGDVHREWDALARQLRFYGITQQELIQVGDFGVGFGPRADEQAELLALDAVLADTGNTLWVIRGNHDDPAYFTGAVGVPCARIRFLPDYSLLRVEGRKILFVGGATSSDRVLRTSGRDYWLDEEFCLDEQRVAGLNLEDLWAVVTHTAPDFAPPLRLNTAPLSFVPGDPDLFTDLRRERSAVARLHTLLSARARPAYWFYGHFHASASEDIAGTRFVMVASMEMYRVWSASAGAGEAETD